MTRWERCILVLLAWIAYEIRRSTQEAARWRKANLELEAEQTRELHMVAQLQELEQNDTRKLVAVAEKREDHDSQGHETEGTTHG